MADPAPETGVGRHRMTKLRRESSDKRDVETARSDRFLVQPPKDAQAMTKGTQDSASKPTDTPASENRATPPPGAAAQQAAAAQQPRVVSRPEDVAGLVLMQIDLVNARKDDLTIAIKGLSDLTRQLVRAYGENMQTIDQLQSKLKKVGREGRASGSSSSNGKRKSSR
jgi:hypothetical protein